MDNVAFVVKYVLERSEDEPLVTRIKLYNALAEICGDEKEANHLARMAASLLEADQLCREFIFSEIQPPTVTLQQVSDACVVRGIPSISALATEIGCSRQVIYLAIERPTRYSKVYQAILSTLGLGA